MLLLAAAPARSSETAPGWLHRTWTVRDGLPTNLVTQVLRTSDGYLWISTFDGLARFDGVRFEVYRTRTTPGLRSNRIRQIWADRHGGLWVLGAFGELARYRQGAFEPVTLPSGARLTSRLALAEAADGSVWLGTTQGLWLWRNGHAARVRLDGTSPEILALALASDGTLWVGTHEHGLLSLSGGPVTAPASGRVTAYRRDDGLLSETVQALLHDGRGALWIGTPAGLQRLGDGSLAAVPSEDVPPLTEIVFLELDAGGGLWAGSDAGLLHLEDGVLRPFGPPGRVPSDAFRTPPPVRGPDGRLWLSTGRDVFVDGEHVFTSDSTLTGMTLDPEHSLWLGTNTGGLHQIRHSPVRVLGKPEGLPDDIVYPILEGPDGSVWLGTLYGGLAHLSQGRVRGFGPEQGVPARFVWALGRTRSGELWVGGSGLCRMLPDRCTQAGLPPVLIRAIVRAVYEDSELRLWAGTDDGVFLREAGVWRRFAPGGRDLSRVTVRVFYEARDGALWMGTADSGLLVYRAGRLSRLTRREGLPSDRIRAIHQDEAGSFWIGTEDRGLCRLRHDRHVASGSGFEIVAIDPSHGLFDDTIHQILEDGRGRVWMNTNRGIFWVRRTELDAVADGRAARVRSVSYTEQDGLRNREGNGGMQPAGMRASDGRLWFPSQQGAIVVDPARVEVNPVPPPVRVEALIADERRLDLRQDRVELGPTERDFEIHYTALSFVDPEKVRFRYRLLGLDDDWIEAGARRAAYFTSVPPGDYRFEVLAANNDGVWNEEGVSLELGVVPRFHETPLFTGLVIAGSVLLGLGAARWRIRLLQSRAHRLERQVGERTRQLEMEKSRTERALDQVAEQARVLAEVGELKDRLFTNVSHELRTPLTLILGPLEQLLQGESGPLPPSVKHGLETMRRSARALSRRVTQILDLQKIDSGGIELRLRRLDLCGFVRSVVEAFTPLAEQRGIRLSCHSALEKCPARFDDEQLEKVLANLLSNALKFTPRGGRVELELREEPGWLAVSVTDDGPGIEPEALPRIFERFYQAGSSRGGAWEGTGVGLALAHELVELHGGSLAVDSELGRGTTFTVRLPRTPWDAEPEPVPEGETPALAPPAGPAPILSEAGQAPEGAPDESAGDEGSEASLEPASILVVEDNVELRAYLGQLLAPFGRVLEAEDGAEGLERAREELPDLIVADVMMPRLDGLAMSRALHEDPRTDGIPVLFLTARAAASHEVEALRTGADDYVTKPFSAEVLRARAAGLMARRQRLRERLREELERELGARPAETSAEPAPAPGSPLLERARGVIREHLLDDDFQVPDLADALALGRSQLHRRLKAEADVTPSQLLMEVRLERAEELLRHKEGNVTEVAFAVGFKSLSHFHRCFRQRFGLAPSELLRAGR